MREGWTETSLGEVVAINPEAAKNFAQGEEIVYVDLASVSAESGITTDLFRGNFGDAPGRARRVIRSNDVLVSTVRPYLKGFALVPEHLDGEIASTGFAVLRANPKKVLSGFVWAVIGMNNFVEYLMDRATGSSYPAVRPDDVASFEFNLPPLVEQKRIVDLVASVDTYIDALQQQADTARTTFLSICEVIVLTGENMKPLHEVASVIMGQSPEGSTCNTDGIGTPLLTGPTEFTKRIVGPPRQWTSKETKLSQSGDILFCVRGATAGRINIGNYKSVIGRGLAAIRCDNSEDTNFVRFALQVGLGQLLPAAGGTIFPNISQSQLRNFEVSWPSENRRAELSGLVRSIEEVVLRTEHAIDDAKNLRSGLLSDLLSGEHEIPESYDVFVGAA